MRILVDLGDSLFVSTIDYHMFSFLNHYRIHYLILSAFILYQILLDLMLQ